MTQASDTHSKTLGYVLWIFGFTGAHSDLGSTIEIIANDGCVWKPYAA